MSEKDDNDLQKEVHTDAVRSHSVTDVNLNKNLDAK